MKYRAQLRLDFDKIQRNEYQKLIAALVQVGWKYVQTSSLAIETDDIDIILRAMVAIARQCQASGVLTGLSFDVQGTSNFNGIRYKAIKNHPNALAQVSAKPLP